MDIFENNIQIALYIIRVFVAEKNNRQWKKLNR